MERFKNILLVSDDGDSGQETLARAVELATRNQAKLTLIKVISQVPDNYRVFITSLLPEEIMELAVRENKLLLEKQIASFEKSISIELKVIVGREFIEIIREVLREKHDLVIKSARGMGGRIGVLFGTTAMHLLRKCPCPVWLIKPKQGKSYGRIMAAVDVDPAMNEDNALNNKIMQMATSLAQTENSELHVVYSWKKLDLIYLTGELDYVPPLTFIESSEEAESMHIKWLQEFVEQYKDQQFQKHLVEGSAGVALPAFAENHQIDLVVMGTVCRTGIPGFFIGNTAEKILNRIGCSVLAVKPDGFVSPVQLDDE
jgi:nucleotide-binding universal stress UspA family protein